MKTVLYRDTRLGRLGIVQEGEALTHLLFAGQAPPAGAEPGATPLLERAAEQLCEYLAGARSSFDLPLNPSGTDFQRRTWKALLDIPAGETRSYGQLAAAVGNPKACRAVGMSNNRNPIPIFIPCHRVVGADGGLVGYGGGLPLKQALLDLEKAYR